MRGEDLKKVRSEGLSVSVMDGGSIRVGSGDL